MATGSDTDIDRLFQLPLAEFTAARNALAKQAGADGAAIKALSRPPIAAWAINQLYFQDREVYDALVDASVDLRQTHKAVLEGRKADLRSATREHDLALDAALKRTVALMQDAGQPVTDTTRQSIVNTLRALPADDPPGRLTRTLSPGGFEMLAGITVGQTGRAGGPQAEPPPRSRTARSAAAPKKDTTAAQAAARDRERRAAAERAVRDAEHRARQAEFAAARTAREAAKATERLERARREFEAAQAELEESERAAQTAGAARDAAERQLRESDEAVRKARKSVGR